ncbi:MAG TPA: DUF72 domain-containing protein [Myxococcaceae bacterium]|nr:DUF72 domain-containing protein [Myxococcaceae bacterium]
MRTLIGTSGYSYPAWKGSFYPKDLPAKRMLPFYAERFSAVEINNTFYRMPGEKLLSSWAEQVGPDFQFALKAPQRITHQKRLVDAESVTQEFVRIARGLGGRLGPLLFQLPPYMKKDLPRLQAFLELLPPDVRVTFEFRHPSWVDDEVHGALQSHGAALCLSETDETEPPRVATADWGYLRLRRTDYAEGALEAWAKWIQAQAWKGAFIFFKHEDEGRGPAFAERLRTLWRSVG